ncbi:GGDEF domain-containing protein [Deferribacter thermophilus]|uniref:GGDEF domain-containing protein n=1 Tax=Deferribacter thermophilus TaxID=53573 RepID=UPI003C2BF089
MVFVISIATFTGWVLSKILGGRIILPVSYLSNRTKLILKGEKPKHEYKYPENEIGQIANYLEKLTTEAIYQKNLELQKLNNELKIMSETDQLTKIYNRRKIERKLNSEFMRYKRYKRVFSIILFDIDDFKSINDTYGHNSGDFVLIEVSNIVKESIRKSDSFGRWGGEEFIILCPETNGVNAKVLAEKIRERVSKHNFGLDRNVTISVGIAEMNDKIEELDALLSQADKNLYKAKKQGKNRCIFE